jgi:hypothetical protein
MQTDLKTAQCTGIPNCSEQDASCVKQSWERSIHSNEQEETPSEVPEPAKGSIHLPDMRLGCKFHA